MLLRVLPQSVRCCQGCSCCFYLLIATRLTTPDLSDLKDRITFTKCDVTKPKDLEDAIAAAEKEHGPTDCMINNAGVMLLGMTDTQDPQQWSTMINVNITGVLNGIRAVAAGMKERKSGTIINISSIAGH